jgi:hypothetical protein
VAACERERETDSVSEKERQTVLAAYVRGDEGARQICRTASISFYFFGRGLLFGDFWAGVLIRPLLASKKISGEEVR